MSTHIRLALIALTLAWTGGMAVRAADPGGQSTLQKTEREADSAPFKYVNPETARLEPFVGPWDVIETHFDARGEVVGKVKGKEEITWILDRRAIQRTYTSGTAPNVYRATGTLTFNDVERKYHGVWFDNASTVGPRTTKGEWMEENRAFEFGLESVSQDGSKVQYRVVERFVHQEKRVATTYLIKGDESIRRMVVTYTRPVPCPDRLRIIDDITVGRRSNE